MTYNVPDMQSGRTRALPCRMQAAQQRDAGRVAMAWHCKRTGLSEQGKLLYEESGLNLNHLPEEVAVNVEEDYQVCVRMLARLGEGKRERQKAKGAKCMKRTFTASVWQEGDWFVAQCLEVDVASQGETEEEALTNLREALELHFEPPCATVTPHVRSIEVEVSVA